MRLTDCHAAWAGDWCRSITKLGMEVEAAFGGQPQVGTFASNVKWPGPHSSMRLRSAPTWGRHTSCAVCCLGSHTRGTRGRGAGWQELSDSARSPTSANWSAKEMHEGCAFTDSLYASLREHSAMAPNGQLNYYLRVLHAVLAGHRGSLFAWPVLRGPVPPTNHPETLTDSGAW